MPTFSSYRSIIFQVILILLFVAACSPQAGDVSASLDELKTKLQDQGFTILEGQLSKFDLVTICCAGQTPTCMANNAGAPYMTLQLPKSPSQTVENIMPWGFRLAPDEAIVLIGKTPPPMAYFSFEPFRTVIYSEKDVTQKVIFEPVGNSINNLTIKTNGPDVGNFEQEYFVILTSDQSLERKIRESAQSAGYPEKIINTSVIPTAITHLGGDQMADEFVFLHRMFLPEPGKEQALLDYLHSTQTAFRLVMTENHEPDPFPVPQLRVRGTGVTEMDLMPAVKELRQAILQKYAGYKANELTTGVWLTDGYDGLQREINQYGPTRDTLYLRSDPYFKLSEDTDDFLIVYGVNHEATGKATYSNLSIYVDPNLLLGMVTANSRQFAGSAVDYLPNHPLLDKLYAWKVARNCQGDPNCLEVKLESCARVDLNAMPDLWVGFRAYLERETMVGPAATELIYDQVIHFTR